MAVHEQLNRTTDALRLTEQDLSLAIEIVRRKSRQRVTVTARAYLRLIREVYDLQVKAKALGAAGPLIEPLAPIPFSQFVGKPADQIFAANWRIDRRIFPRTAPLHFNIAAE